MRPVRIYWKPALKVWIADCSHYGLWANGLTPASAYANLVTLYKRNRSMLVPYPNLNPTSSPAIQAGLDRLPRC